MNFGVDVKANLLLLLHEQLIFVFTMHQENTESNDDYSIRFNSHAQNLDLAGGRHIFAALL